MPDASDLAFVKAAVSSKLLTAEQGAKFQIIQNALHQQNIDKGYARIAVEGGWIPRAKADALLAEMNEARPGCHPALVVAMSSLPLEASAQAVFAAEPAARDLVEGLRPALEALGFRRSVGELASDLGLVKVKLDADRVPASGTKTTSRVGETHPTKPSGVRPPEERATAVRPSTRVREAEPSERATSVRQRQTSVRTAPPPTAEAAPPPAPRETAGRVEGPRRNTSIRTKSPVAPPAEPAPPPSERATSVRAKTSSSRIPAPTAAPGRGTSVRTKAPAVDGRATAVRPAPKKNKALILVGAGVGALALIVTLVVMATRTQTTPPKPVVNPPPEVVKNPTKPSDPPKKDPPKETPRPVDDPDEAFKRDLAAKREKDAEALFTAATAFRNEDKWTDAWAKLDELRRTFANTDFFKNNESGITGFLALAKEKSPDTSVTPTPVDPPKPPEEKNLAALKAAYERRKAERLVAAQKRIEDAKRAIEDARVAEKARLEALMKRVQGAKLTVATKNGLKLNNATVVTMSRDVVKLNCDYEGSAVEMDFPWEVIDDKSYIALQTAMHKADGAAGWYEIGRQCITRKLWKEAKAAFDECRKADASWGDRCPDLTPILSNQGAFKGASKRIGKDVLVVTYDWSDDDQAQDWKAAAPGEFKVSGGQATLTPRGQALWSLKEVDFDGELSIDADVVIEEKSTLIIGCFMNAMDRKVYYLHLGAQGAQLFRWDGSQPAAPAAKKDGKITGSIALRFSVRGGSWKVMANNNEVFSASEATYTKGWMYLGCQGGPVTLKKMTLTGKSSQAELDKLFAETEVLVRRALEGDLKEKKKRDERELEISADDEYFLAQVPEALARDYDKARDRVRAILKRGNLQIQDINTLRDRAGNIVSKSIIEQLTEVINRAPPELGAAWFWRGKIYAMWGKVPEARKDYLEAMKSPDFYEARAALAELMFNELKFEKAQEYVNGALKLAPDDASAMGLHAFLRFIAGDAKGAMAGLEIALRLDPDDYDLRERQRNLANVIKGPQHLGAKHVKEFPHYIVMTDISMEKTKLYGDRLEAAYAYYKETFKAFYKEDPSRPKPRIAIFNTREAYLTYGELTLGRRQESTLGYFHPMYKELLLFEDVDMDDTLQTMYHEAFHQFMNCMVPRAPFWYNEGIAEYMGAITVEKGKIVAKAKILDGRLKGLKMYLRQALPFEQIMLQTPGEFYSGPVSFKYAQAWSMLHFFYEHSGGKYRSLIDAYYQALLDGKESKEAYDAAFGSTDLKELKKEWTGYVEKMEPKK